MGNCAGKSKDLETEREAPLPAVEVAAPAVEVATVPKEQDGGEIKKEEPSTETSEAVPEPAKVDAPAVEAKPVEAEAAKPSEPAVEVKAEEAKVEAPVATA